MKIFNIILFFIHIIKNVNCFIPLHLQNNKNNILISKKKYNNCRNIFKKNNELIVFYKKNNNEFDKCNENNKYNEKINSINKISNFFKLIRYNNIIPTTLLCFSGGWIINPSISNLLYSTSFIISTVDTILIMSASMVLNDIFDLEIDKINSPDRPIANGSINIIEAVIFALLLIGTSEYLTLTYLNDSLKLIIHLVIINITIYSPILKRIIIIKNISCASLVAFSLFFSGLSTTNSIINNNDNFGLLSLAMSVLFFGSWSNEILLDIRDINGDKKNNINTFPVIFGKEKSWILTNIILYYGIISNTLSIEYLYNNKKLASLLIIILSPLLINLYNIKKENYSEKSIVKYMKYSNYPLFVLLLYLCLIAKFY
jgi:4-hydroxybenzoate polyprenyltransferase